MEQIEVLTQQTEDAYKWVNKLVGSVPLEQWNMCPPVVESTISWQVGHLILSFYYHSVMVIRGHKKEILEQVPMKEYNTLFFMNSDPKNVAAKISPEVLHKHLLWMEEKSLEVLRTLSDNELTNSLEPTPMPHPVAKTKYEALDWNIKHTLWHCGQIAIIKRIVNQRYDFNLNS